ncbi:MAG: hypothetical protein RIR64_1331, partial [Bacteroidota bacterium]
PIEKQILITSKVVIANYFVLNLLQLKNSCINLHDKEKQTTRKILNT